VERIEAWHKIPAARDAGGEIEARWHKIPAARSKRGARCRVFGRGSSAGRLKWQDQLCGDVLVAHKAQVEISILLAGLGHVFDL
jgi:hypothetical protein